LRVEAAEKKLAGVKIQHRLNRCMNDDYIDDDGTIWIWKVLARPSYPAHDPRHFSPEMRDRLTKHRLAQMRYEAACNIAKLRSLRRD